MEETPNTKHTTKPPTTATRKEKIIGEKEKRSEEDRRKNTMRRTGSDRRQAITLQHELLKLGRQDIRTLADRRNGKGERIKSIYALK